MDSPALAPPQREAGEVGQAQLEPLTAACGGSSWAGHKVSSQSLYWQELVGRGAPHICAAVRPPSATAMYGAAANQQVSGDEESGGARFSLAPPLVNDYQIRRELNGVRCSLANLLIGMC